MSDGATKLNWIDAMRALAVLMVIAVHTSQQVPHTRLLRLVLGCGQMGVQLFFLTSAITLCLSSETRMNEAHPIRKFYMRRWFRIAPLYYLGIVVYYGVSVVARTNQHLIAVTCRDYSVTNVVVNILFLHGFYPPANNNIVPGGWSIATEMGFYVLFPFLFQLSQRFTAKIWAYAAVLLTCAVGLCEIAFGIRSGYWVANNNFLYFALPNQLSVFLLGIWTYHQLKNQRNPSRRGFSAMMFGVLGGASLTAALWVARFHLAFFLIPITCAYTFSVLIRMAVLADIKYPDMLLRIGRRSYSMYILHFLSAYAVGFTFRYANIRPSAFLLAFEFVANVFLAYWSAGFTERVVEGKGIKLGRKMIGILDRPTAATSSDRLLRCE